MKKRQNHPEETNCAQVTIVTSSDPSVLTKGFSLENGALLKSEGGFLLRGQARICNVADLGAFAGVLSSLGHNQALTYGTPETSPVDLTTKALWEQHGKPAGETARTKETFFWPEGPAIMMIDYDPQDGTDVLSRGDLVAAIRHAAPGLKEVEMLWWPSASSFIKNEMTGETLHELRGQRLYLLVRSGRDIPRAGNALSDRLWRTGYGYMRVSGAGTLLARTIVDAAVWQSNHLDFAGGASCTPPLFQDRGDPVIIPGTQEMIDSVMAIPDLTQSEAKSVKTLQEGAREDTKDEATRVRDAWLDKRAGEIAGPGADEAKMKFARERAASSLETNVLSGQFAVHVIDAGQTTQVSVDDILDQPDRYHRAKTLDPLEPDYDGGRAVGMLFLDGNTKNLYSFARGGANFRLERDLNVITVLNGKLVEAVNTTINVLRNNPSIFDFGEELVQVDEGRIFVMDKHRLEQFLGHIIQFKKFNAKGQLFLANPPVNLANRIISLRRSRHLKPLVSVITAPTLRLDGSILEEPGYDPETHLFYYRPKECPKVQIPTTPNAQEVRSAMSTLWKPFEQFPFVGDKDRGIFLAALLSAAVRPILPTAPGFGFDAPVQGSGKTLLATCIAALAGDTSPIVYPHADGNNDEEIRKRLMAFLRGGGSAMVWDNIVGTFDSASMAAALTSSDFTDRILGLSESITVPNRALFLFTGNNMTLKGDMVRRILMCRIDPATDRPFERSFDLDPLDYVKEHRPEMIAAALTVLRGWLSSNKRPPKGRMASFEKWSDLVRNAVCYVDRYIEPGRFSDPMAAVSEAVNNDPELEALGNLLNALSQKYKAQPFTSADVLKDAKRSSHTEERLIANSKGEAPPPGHLICTALMAFNENATKTAANIGRFLGYRKDRIVDGLVLRQSKDAHTKTMIWRVEEVSEKTY